MPSSNHNITLIKPQLKYKKVGKKGDNYARYKTRIVTENNVRKE